MKKSISMFLLLAGFLLSISCSKDEVSEQDPIIGQWKLQRITAGNEGVDVNDLPCYGQSTLNVTKSEMTLLLKSPEDGGDSCITDSSSFGWVKNGNSYQVVDDEAGEYITITLNGGDLLLKVAAGGNSSTFIFRK
ncbi:MAG: lipocalin family protein [Bacteroidia bacterium]|nr:lipocalin family protein [Bacteroidia bacterium]